MAGKTLFITGASTGIGAETARAAVAAGWSVGLFARSTGAIETLAAELGDAALALPGDATSRDDQAAAVAKMVDHFGPLTAAFANAGRGTSQAGAQAGDPDDWRGMVDLNIMGMLYTAHVTLPHLQASTGQFLVTGSAAGRRHLPGSVYGATKWFVHGWAGNLAEEMREWGGRCTLIAPGMVDTPFFDEAKPTKLQAEDVARAVVFALDADPRATVREVFVMPTH